MIASFKNETINILKIGSDLEWDFAFEYALSAVNSRHDILPNHRVEMYTYYRAVVSLKPEFTIPHSFLVTYCF